jgi:acyl transferase domain-containing protein
MQPQSPSPPGNPRKLVESIWREVLGVSEVDPDRTFADQGGTSLGANQLVAKLARRLGIEVPVIRIFEYPTLRQFLRFLLQGQDGELVPDAAQAAAPVPEPADKAATAAAAPNHDIAIVGMACRFPGASSVTEFWQNLIDGRESIRPLADDEISAAVAPELRRDPRYVRAAGLIDRPYAMDAAFFDIKPMEARLTDPQHRVLLETSFEALENAGHGPGSFAGRTAVFAGTEDNSYYKTEIVPFPEAEARAGRFSVMTGNEKDFVAMRIAHKLDLRGPAVSVHTACSTSLVAVIMACRSLRNGESDLALAGGASVHFPTPEGYYFQEGGVFSPDGHCRPFDKDAEGTVFTDGVGVVVLKRLDDAIRDRNAIVAVIKGGAINNDGAAKISFSAPSVSGQAACIAEAMRDADVAPETIGYVEAHGTATPVGDPIELEGLRQAFGPLGGRRQFCGLGSVKSNIGHTTAAAGVASLIKTALALRNGLIPASLHYRAPNPALDLEHSPFFVVDGNRTWQRGATPRRAGVSSFGIGGTNAHVILEEAPPLPEAAPVPADLAQRPFEILPVSSRTPAQRDRLLHGLDHEPHALRDLAFTLQQGRSRFKFRGAAIRLPRWPQGNTVVPGTQPALDDPCPVFLFPGQGAQYIRMGLSLSAEFPEFRRTFTQCCALLSAELGFDFAAFIFDAANQQTLEDTRYTQPALFAIEVALGRMLIDWGLHPAMMVGHSVGEFAAAHLAGVFSLEDGVRLIAARGRLMAGLPRGRMLSARAPIDTVLAAAGEAVDVASINSPVHSVLAGPDERIARVQARLEAAGIPCRPLHTSHAFHSAMMDPVVEPFLAFVRTLDLHPPRIPIVSTVTGEPLRDQDATDPAYWARHLRATVQFSPALQRVLQDGGNLFIEVGPRATLANLATQHFARGSAPAAAVSMLGESAEPESEVLGIATALARIWNSGLELPWQRIWPAGNRVACIGAYPFERQDFRFSEGRPLPRPLQPADAAAVAAGAAGALGAAVVPVPAPPGAVSAAPTDPAHALSGRLATLFQDFAGMAIPSPDTSFIEAGFDSLVLMQIGVELGKTFGVSVSLGDLMRRHNTLARLAVHLAAQAPQAAAPAAAAAAIAAGAGAAAPVPAPVAGPSSVAIGALAANVSGLAPVAAHTMDAAQLVELQMRQLKELFDWQLRHLAQAGASPAAAAPAAPSRLAATPLRSAPPAPGGVVRRPDAAVAPLTLMQERVRFTEEMYPGRNVYSISTGYRLAGNMNPALFAQALRHVVRRQSALRTYVAQGADGKWTQRTREELEYRLPFEDLSELPDEQRDTELRLQMQAIIDQPFDIHVAPLFRAALWKLGTQEHVFLFVPHHLIWDGWSFDLLNDELAGIYEALVRGSVPELAPLDIDYGDYAQWHGQWLASAQCAAQFAYWKGLFERLPPPQPILTDRPRNAVRSGKGSLAWLHIDSERSERLRAIARSAGGSLSMLMTAVYAAVIQQMAGGDHVVLGIAVRGRSRPELEPVMGFFSNMLPLPLQIDPRQSFVGWVASVAERLAEALNHQDVPFEILASEPRIAAWARHAGVPVHALISFQDARRRRRNWGELASEHLVLAQHTATDDFGLWVTDRPEGIEGRLVTNADVFGSRTGPLVRNRLEIFLARILARPELSLAELTALDDSEREILASWSSASGGTQVLDALGAPVPIGVPGAAWRNGVATGQRARWSFDGRLQILDAGGAEPSVGGPAGAPDAARDPAADTATLSPTEQILARVWCSVLNLPAVRAEHNFFELGGTSLEAMQVAMQLEKLLGRTVNAHQFVMGSLRSIASGYEGDAAGAGQAPAGPGALALESARAAASGAARRLRVRRERGGVMTRLAGMFRPGDAGAPARLPVAALPVRAAAHVAEHAGATVPALADASALSVGGRAAGGTAAPVPGPVGALAFDPETRADAAALAFADADAAAAAQIIRGSPADLVVTGPGGLRRVRHAQPPVPGAFRAPFGPDGQAWYRRDEATGRYEVLGS